MFVVFSPEELIINAHFSFHTRTIMMVLKAFGFTWEKKEAQSSDDTQIYYSNLPHNSQLFLLAEIKNFRLT